MQSLFTQGNGFGNTGFVPIQRGRRMGQETASSSPEDLEHKSSGWMGPLPALQPHPMPQEGQKIKPDQNRKPFKNPVRRDRLTWSAMRLCRIMTRFADSSVDAEVKSHVFWSYVRHSGNEAAVLKAYTAACPTLEVPAKPVTPVKELVAETKEKEGFHGKTLISYQEAKELQLALTEVLKPLTPEEAANELAKEACLRDFSAGNFPALEELQEDLAAFVAAGDETATFEISKGQLVVAGKAIDCAVALGRGKAIKTALTAGGIGIGALALLFLL